jgi:hypothetical protein
MLPVPQTIAFDGHPDILSGGKVADFIMHIKPCSIYTGFNILLGPFSTCGGFDPF